MASLFSPHIQSSSLSARPTYSCPGISPGAAGHLSLLGPLLESPPPRPLELRSIVTFTVLLLKPNESHVIPPLKLCSASIPFSVRTEILRIASRSQLRALISVISLTS